MRLIPLLALLFALVAGGMAVIYPIWLEFNEDHGREG